MYKQIKDHFEHEFEIANDGIYAISIKASCKNGKFFGLFGGEDLRVEIDDMKLREIPAKSKPRYYNIPPAWNGTELKGLPKTVIFILELKKGKHFIKFIPRRSAVIENEPSILKIENLNDIKLNLQEQAQDGNRRPWITIVLVNLPLRILDASIKCEWRKKDSNDIKLIIDRQIWKNKNGNWWGKNWFWQGRNSKGSIEERRFYFDLKKANHYIEFWADRMPTLSEIWMYLGIADEGLSEKEDTGKIYNDPVKIADEFNEIYVLKDAAFEDSTSMTEEEIQSFLSSYGNGEQSHISNIKFNGQKAAYWIQKVAEQYFINPKLILAKLQAEQRLIKGEKSVNPSKNQLNGAMGVGMFDDETVIEEMQGFVNQITYAAKYFRDYFNEAEAVDFTHTNVDGKELKAINAATYSLYRYTPHIAGPKLVYAVYKMFFGVEDLGGLLQKENNEGSISLKLVHNAVLFSVILMFGIFFARKYIGKTIFSWDNEIIMEDENKIITELKIFSGKKATEDDGPYCGFRFGNIYESVAQLFLFHNNEVADSIDLTNPELIMPDLSEEHLLYYKPWDIDGDGLKQEFIVQKYASCNGNLLSFIRVNKELREFEAIPIIYEDGAERFDLYIDIGEDALRINNSGINVKYYNEAKGEFIESRYRFDRENGKLAWEDVDFGDHIFEAMDEDKPAS